MDKDYLQSIEKAERRFFKVSDQVEIRNEGEGTIEGVAAVVDKTTDLGWFEERIAPGAFDNVLKDDTVALFNHNPDMVLARSTDGTGTLSLGLNKRGDLTYSYKTPDRSYAKDLQDAIKSGDVRGSSFGFIVEEDEWIHADEKRDKDLRTIKKFRKLLDVSPVTFPAYTDTSVAKRSMESVKPEKTKTSKSILRKKLRLKTIR